MPVKEFKEIHPAIPPKYEPADIKAIQEVFRGTADSTQQIRAMNWILFTATGINDFEYRTNDRDHAFASGKRSVGLQIVKMCSLNPQAFITDMGK